MINCEAIKRLLREREQERLCSERKAGEEGNDGVTFCRWLEKASLGRDLGNSGDLGVNEAGLVAFQEEAGSAKGLRQEHVGCGGTAKAAVEGELGVRG